MLRKPNFRTLAVTTLALSLAACKSVPKADDTSLNAAVQSRLASDAAIAAEPIQTFVQGGVAILQGTVSSQAARALAASDASQIPGIHSVVNNLTVASPQQAPATVAAAHTAPIVTPQQQAFSLGCRRPPST